MLAKEMWRASGAKQQDEQVIFHTVQNCCILDDYDFNPVRNQTEDDIASSKSFPKPVFRANNSGRSCALGDKARSTYHEACHDSNRLQHHFQASIATSQLLMTGTPKHSVIGLLTLLAMEGSVIYQVKPIGAIAGVVIRSTNHGV